MFILCSICKLYMRSICKHYFYVSMCKAVLINNASTNLAFNAILVFNSLVVFFFGDFTNFHMMFFGRLRLGIYKNKIDLIIFYSCLSVSLLRLRSLGKCVHKTNNQTFKNRFKTWHIKTLSFWFNFFKVNFALWLYLIFASHEHVFPCLYFFVAKPTLYLV